MKMYMVRDIKRKRGNIRKESNLKDGMEQMIRRSKSMMKSLIMMET